MALIIKNAHFLDWQTLHLKKTDLKVQEGASGSIEFGQQFESSKTDKVIDAKNKFVTKSFVCAHHHAYSLLARGMPVAAKAPENFGQILKQIWWKLDRQLDLEMVKASALGTALYCAKHGITYVIDHHSSPLVPEGALEIISQAFEQIGLGHLLCLELSDRDGADVLERNFEASQNFLKQRPDKGLVGLHASFTVGDDLIKRAAELLQATHSGVHIHVAEDKLDQLQCEEKYHMRVIERLSAHGLLESPKTILAHCLHLTPKERKILSHSKAWIAVNTESNLNNAVGSFSSEALAQDRIMLGTDGMHSDMIQSSKAHYLQLHASENMNVLNAYQRLRNAHHYLESNNFPGDGENNLVIFNYDSPTTLNENNFLGHFFYGMDSSQIETVISHGKVIVENKIIKTVNENDILSFCKEQGERLWKRL